MGKLTNRKEYNNFLGEIKDRIRAAQYEALKKVNKELIGLYWDIGSMIVDRQGKHKWGKAVVENLAKDLHVEFVGIAGFSTQNLWYMRQFYLFYRNDKKLQPMVGEIGWSHNVIIMSKCKDKLKREFYIRMTRRMGWTKNVLIHQIENKSYEKTMVSQTNFAKNLPTKIHKQAKLAVKDEYSFDFLELGEKHSELELEKGLMARVNRFLIEMGGSFTFLGNQFRLEVEGQEYFIDILLYHRRLKSLVAIELKIGDFKPEYAGKMQFYLVALDELVKEKNENPSIGIILCKDKKRTIVEYALRISNKPIAVAKYKVTDKLPSRLQKELPAPKQIEKLIEDI